MGGGVCPSMSKLVNNPSLASERIEIPDNLIGTGFQDYIKENCDFDFSCKRLRSDLSKFSDVFGTVAPEKYYFDLLFGH